MFSSNKGGIRMKRAKTMRVLGVCTVAALALAVNGQAQEEAAAPAVEAAAAVDVASAYIFRGATISDEVSVQPTLEAAFYGVTLGTWANFNTADEVRQFDEIDYYASYALPVGKCPVGLSVGYTEYTYPTAYTGAEVDDAGVLVADGAGLEADREVNVTASYETGLTDSLTLSTALAGNLGIEGPFLDEGLYVSAETGLEQAVCDTVAVNCGVVVGAELGDNYEENGVSHVTATAGASYRMLAATAGYVFETNDEIVEVDEDFFGSASLSVPF